MTYYVWNRSSPALVVLTFSLLVSVSVGISLCNGGRGFVVINGFPRGGSTIATEASLSKKRGLLKLPRFLQLLLKKHPDGKVDYELKEQIRSLEAAIRRAKEEIRQLRSQLILANSRNVRQFASDVQEIKMLQHILEEEREKFRSEIEKLLLIIEELEKTREDLLQSLEVEKKKKAEQEVMLEKEKSRVLAMEQQAKEQLEALKKSLLEESRKKIHSLEMELKQQSQADIQTLETKWKKKLTIDESEKMKEYEKKLADQRRKGEEAIEKEKRQFQTQILRLETEWKQKRQAEESQRVKEMEQRISEEKRKGEEAVEREKAKMRKLVKALAEREEREAEKNTFVRNTLAGRSPGGKDSTKITATWNQLNKSSSVRSVINNKKRR